MTVGEIAVIVLAAGTSSRLGRPKQMLPVSSVPLLSLTLDIARNWSHGPRVLVLGAHAEEIRSAVDSDGFDVAINPDFAAGQSTSLRTGLAALPETVSGAIVLLGDQPLVPRQLLTELAAQYNPSTDIAVRPRYADGPGNPILLSCAIFAELMALTGDVGARNILRKHRDRIREIDWTRSPAPRDVDTEDDYAALLLDWSSLGAPDVPAFCQRCGSPMSLQERHARLRPVCPSCGFTWFADPKLSAVVVLEVGGKIVLHRRAMTPARGLWSLPGGFVDRGEDIESAARREVWEETGITITELTSLGIVSERGEVVVLAAYHASAPEQALIKSSESLDIGAFDPDDLPPLAFHRDRRIIDLWRATR